MSTLFDPIAQAREAGAAAIESPICSRSYVEVGLLSGIRGGGRDV
jgi:hypothetical protein